jgi:hypothetical protein
MVDLTDTSDICSKGPGPWSSFDKDFFFDVDGCGPAICFIAS